MLEMEMSVGFLFQNPTHMRHPSPPHGVGQMSPHPMHGHMMPQMGQVCHVVFSSSSTAIFTCNYFFVCCNLKQDGGFIGGCQSTEAHSSPSARTARTGQSRFARAFSCPISPTNATAPLAPYRLANQV